MRKRGRGRERRGERIPSRLRADSTEPHAGLDPMNREIMTLVETRSRMPNQLSHPGAPELQYQHFNSSSSFKLLVVFFFSFG